MLFCLFCQNPQKYPYHVREDSDNIWCLDKVPHLKHYLWVINDAKKLRIVEDVISEYERKVIPVRGEFRRGNLLFFSLRTEVLFSPDTDYNVPLNRCGIPLLKKTQMIRIVSSHRSLLLLGRG